MPDRDEALPITEEVLKVEKRTIPLGHVRVETRTETVQEIAEAELETSEVEVLRVPIGREIEAPPEIRTEGETTIIPVVEEKLIVERRLVLTEEIHVRRRRSTETVQVPVSLRRQRATIARDEPD